VAKKNLAEFGNVEYHVADGAKLPFEDEMLDAVFANMYLHHTIDPLAAIFEMVRVLRPGGRLVITDMDEHPYAWLKEEMADVWQGFEHAQIRAWFQEAGLVNSIVDGSGQSCSAESADPIRTGEQDRSVRINVFVASGTRRMTMRDAVQENYAAVAKSASSCGCSAPAAEAAVISRECERNLLDY
jgi:arsenite methyltransferase